MKPILIGLIQFYKKAVSPYLGGNCRFSPSCSDYMITAINTMGCVKGLLMGFFRVCRCNPLSAGGFDPVDNKKIGGNHG